MDKIDFVLPWVDGSDKDWIALKNKYMAAENGELPHDPEANADCRYRDYGLLKYWFRGVERFAPWVNRVFFVTCGQKPDWLDESNPKLRLVNHADYIPSDYLPTFQVNTIEMNLHRITELSEQFVYFNDDMFLLRPVKPEFFFRKGLPVTPCNLGIPIGLGHNNIHRIILNNKVVLYRSLDVNHLVWKNILKYINVRELGFRYAAKNILSFAINKVIIPNTFGHFPLPHLKSTFEEIWRTKPQILDVTSRCRFRSDDCVNQWLACAWNMVSGRFYPANEQRMGRYFELNTNALIPICNAINRQSCPQICLNDKLRTHSSDFETCIREVSRAFDTLLPEKSSFEK